MKTMFHMLHNVNSKISWSIFLLWLYKETNNHIDKGVDLEIFNEVDGDSFILNKTMVGDEFQLL